MVYKRIMGCITPEEHETLHLIGLSDTDILELESLGRESVIQILQFFKSLQKKWRVTDADLRHLATGANK